MKFIQRVWQRHETLSIGLLWAAIVIVLFWEALTAGPDRIIGGNDVTYAYLPWLRFTIESVKQGIFPLWNPYLFSGTPFVGNPQTGLFYPATWLALWVGPERAFGLSTALHIWIAALGMVGWLREIGGTRAGAFFASIAYALSGFMSARIWAGHYGPLLEAALWPVLLWTVTRALHRRSIVWAIVAALPFGLMILAGHTPTFVLLALGVGIVVVFEAVRPAVFFTAENAESAKIPNVSAFSAHSAVDQAPASALARDWRKINVRSAIAALGLFGLTALVGVALAAVQILPALTFVENSARVAGISAEFASRFSLPPLHLLQMLIPDFFGEPVQAGYWSVPVFEEYIYYVGVPTLILATLSIFTRDARARFFVAFGVFGLIVALGPDGVVYTILYRFVPLFDLLRAPARAGLWTIFSFAAAAGLCISAIQTSGVDAGKRILSKWSRWPIAVGVGVGLTGAGIAYAQFASSASAPDSGRFYHLAGDMLVFVLLCVAASALIRAWSARIDRAHVWAASLAALLLIDLGVYHVNLVQMVPSTRGAPYAAADRALGDRLKDHRLIWVYADLFELNLGMDFGQYNVYGYDSLITARLQALVDRVSDLSSPIYDMLNVRYVIAEPPLVEKVERVGEADGFTFYERPAKRTAPRAWIVRAIESVADDEAALDRVAADFDPQVAAVVVGEAPCAVEAPVGADSVSIVRYEPNRIEARVDAGAAGLLVFSEIDYPGWAASIDGAPVVIHRVDYGLRGVCVPQGSHGVTLVYDPPELKVGLVVSLAAISLIVLSGVALLRPRKLSRQN